MQKRNRLLDNGMKDKKMNEKMNTLAQITLFIIIAMILLLLIAGFVYLTKNNRTNEQQPEQQLAEQAAKPVATFVKSCLQQVSEQTLQQLSLQSGYFTLPELKTSAGKQEVAFYLFNNQSYLPTKETLKKELEIAIEFNLDSCFDDFKQFRQHGFEIKTEKLKRITVTLGEEINILLSYQVIAEKDADVTVVEDTIIQLPYNFNKIYEVLQAIHAEQIKNPNAVPLGFLAAYAKEQGFKYNLVYGDNYIVTYSILFPDEDSKKQLLFNFAAKYSWEELD